MLHQYENLGVDSRQCTQVVYTTSRSNIIVPWLELLFIYLPDKFDQILIRSIGIRMDSDPGICDFRMHNSSLLPDA